MICVLSLSVSMLMDQYHQHHVSGRIVLLHRCVLPLVIGLVWKRATAPAAFISMLCAVAVGLISEFFLVGKAPGILGLPSNVMAAATSLVVFMAATALTKAPPAEKTAFLSKT